MKKELLLLSLIFYTTVSFAQQFPFHDDIEAFKSQDSSSAPRQGGIVFTGSSSFTLWKDVQEYFPQYTIINRGFGGSTLPDVIRYANDIILPYHPKQVVLYCGENDLASSDTVSVETVFKRFVILFNLVRSVNRNMPFVYVSMKPSPSREKLMPTMDACNMRIKKYLKKEGNTAFVDVYHLMLDANGKPRKELFQEDMLHMNQSGYKIWQKAIMPSLKK